MPCLFNLLAQHSVPKRLHMGSLTASYTVHVCQQETADCFNPGLAAAFDSFTFPNFNYLLNLRKLRDFRESCGNELHSLFMVLCEEVLPFIYPHFLPVSFGRYIPKKKDKHVCFFL